MSESSGHGTTAGGFNSEINVTPMVDVMLVILIIFMVITPLLQSGVPVALPRGENPDEDPNIIRESAVVVAVPADGLYYIDRNTKTEIPELVELVRRRMGALKPGDPQIVYIKGGTNVSYGEVVKVINAIRDAGYQEIGLVADRRRPGEQ
jgi:biopolymer transport protein ExbD/biopolymer transport protein TolR